MENEEKNTEETNNNDTFEHYMIYVDGIFKLDAYSFAEVQDYCRKHSLYGKITYEKV